MLPFDSFNLYREKGTGKGICIVPPAGSTDFLESFILKIVESDYLMFKIKCCIFMFILTCVTTCCKAKISTTDFTNRLFFLYFFIQPDAGYTVVVVY
jgi:hypothetical protein